MQTTDQSHMIKNTPDIVKDNTINAASGDRHISLWILFFRLVVFVQLAAIFVYNLTRLKYEVGFDSSAAMAQAMEIWNQKTIFLQHWQYQTTLGLDSVLLLASLLYGITHNIFLAYGIADCIGILLYLYIFRDILNTLGVKRLARVILYMILLTPYSLEPLGYMPMMFTGAAYYIIKTLIPVMLIDIMVKLHKGISLKKIMPVTVLYLIFIWLTGLSCGLYLFICGILPVILYELWLVIASGKLHTIKNYRILILGITIIIYAGGYLAAKFYGASVYTNDMVLCQVTNITTNFSKWLIGIFELFGAVPSQNIVITSAFGIHYLSHMAAALVLIALIIMVFKKYRAFSSENYGAEKQHVIGMAGSILLVNAAVLLLTNTTYGSDSYEFRYHLIPVVTSMLVVGIGIDWLLQIFAANTNKLLKRVFLIAVSCIWILSNIVFYYYYHITNSYDSCRQLLSIVENDTSCQMIYFIGSDNDKVIDSARITRLLDTNMVVVDGYDIGNFIGWGASTEHHDIDNYNGPVALICSNDAFTEFSDELQEALRPVGTVGDLQIYVWNHKPV